MKGLIRLIRSNRYIITVILSFLAIGIEYFYIVCDTSCSYLRGDLFGIELEYIGIGYMVAIIILSVLKRDMYLLFLLSCGFGIELYLVGFQIRHNTYCPYCLAFGGILILQFITNIDGKRKRLIFLSMLIALILFSLFFKGSTTFQYSIGAPPAHDVESL